MRNRKGDWRDVVSAYTLAVDTKKLYLGFVAVLATVLLMILFPFLYALFRHGKVATLAWAFNENFPLRKFLQGQGLDVLGTFLPLLNPFHVGVGTSAGLVHFAFSIAFYAALLWFWSYYGGAISRITALEYGRDELPTLADGTSMVDSKRTAYFFAPVSPLIGVVIFALLNALGGLIGSIPYAGPILMVIGIIPWFISTVIAVFIIVLGVLSFGLMLPTISIGGKDAFEGWSSAYSYLLWGFSRFVGYSVIALLIGAISTVAVWGICELFVYVLHRTISMGYMGTHAWVTYQAFVGGQFGPAIGISQSPSMLMQITSGIMVAALLGVRALPLAYLFAYFFTANTVICFLMRKHVDRIELDEVYEEKEEEEEEEFAAPPMEEEEEEIEAEEEEEAPEEEAEAEEEAPEPEAELEEEEAEEEPEEEEAPAEEEAPEEEEEEEEEEPEEEAEEEEEEEEEAGEERKDEQS